MNHPFFGPGPIFPRQPLDFGEPSACCGADFFRERVGRRLKSARPDSCWSSSLPRIDLPRRSPAICGWFPVPKRTPLTMKQVSNAKRKLRTRGHVINVPPFLELLGDMVVVVVLPMARFDLLSFRPHHAPLPPHVRHPSRLRIPRVYWRRGLWLVRRMRPRAMLVERRMAVPTLRILERNASVVVRGVFREVGTSW